MDDELDTEKEAILDDIRSLLKKFEKKGSNFIRMGRNLQALPFGNVQNNSYW